MLRSVASSRFEPAVESAYAIVVPTAREVMAKRILDDLGPSKSAGRLPPGPRKKPRTGKRMPISRDDAKAIRDLIEEWPHPKIRWEDVVTAVNKRFGTKWHRQSLANHKVVLAAFQDKKVELRRAAETGRRPKSRSADSTVDYLERQLRDVRDENQELRKQLAEAESRMGRWQQNAFLRGLTLEQLDAPMQENDRGRSDI